VGAPVEVIDGRSVQEKVIEEKSFVYKNCIE
jgi:hypothetical protein